MCAEFAGFDRGVARTRRGHELRELRPRHVGLRGLAEARARALVRVGRERELRDEQKAAARVSQRLGLTREESPEKIEADLCRAFAAEHWRQMSHRLVLHGRYVCTARAPLCDDCPLNEPCPSREKPATDAWEARAAHEAHAMAERAAGFTRL